MKTLAEKIEVMLAAERGETIEMKCTTLASHDWHTPKVEPIAWNWANFDYRVKPPEPREVYIVETIRGDLGDYAWPDRRDSLLENPRIKRIVKFREVFEDE